MKLLSVISAVLMLGQTLTTNAFAIPTHQKKLNREQAMQFFNSSLNYNYDGIVKLSNCSGAVVRFENSKDEDRAIVMSNGHCVEVDSGDGMIKPGEFLYKTPMKRGFEFLNADGSLSGNVVQSEQLLYATMTGTDVSLYTLKNTYGEIKSKFKVNALILDSHHPVASEAIEILSGYWRKGYSCTIDTFVYQLKEGGYVWDDSMRYSKGGCQTIHGTSGSPILSANTHKIIGINNTGNDDGEKCTLDNPCEVSQDGKVYVEKGRSYGEETYLFYTCLNQKGELDVSVNGCKLFHGNRVHHLGGLKKPVVH